MALCLLVVLGGAIRAHGFSNLDLWFDDAWAAAPARVGWGKAVHMVLTAPGYGLALRLWIRLDPATTWFLQIPSFVISLAAIPAVYFLLRFFRSPRWLALSGALVAAVDPILVQYSTRLKEYPFDLLGACLLLVLGERVRCSPTPRRLAALVVATVVVLFMSAGGVAVVAGSGSRSPSRSWSIRDYVAGTWSPPARWGSAQRGSGWHSCASCHRS